MTSLFDCDGLQAAVAHAGAALDAFLLVDDVFLLELAFDGSDRAVLCAKMASDASVRLNRVIEHGNALTRAALLFGDVLEILVPEVGQGGEHWVWRCLTESAESRILDDAGEVLELVEIFHGSLSRHYPVQYFKHAFVAYSARRAFFT